MSARIAPWVAGLTLALAGTTAAARMHQICFEVKAETRSGVTTPTAVFGCAIDGGGSCTISPLQGVGSALPVPLGQFVQAAGTFRHFGFASSAGLMQARIQFFDTNSVMIGERTCSVNAQGVVTNHAGGPSPGAVLTGFTTDASGLVTTGVWKQQTPFAPSARSNLAVAVPFDFVAVGGGAMGVETPTGAMITRSSFEFTLPGVLRTWRAQTAAAGGAAQLHQVTTYAIGLRIEGIHSRDLTPLLQFVAAYSTPAIAAHPVAQANQSIVGGSVILGGTVEAYADSSNAPLDLVGQFATMSAPVLGTIFQCTPGFFRCTTATAVTGWRAESKDHVVAHPGRVSTQMIALPTTLTVNGTAFEVRGKHVSATSAVAAHPAADASGLRGEYALTGVGANVDWRRFDQFGNQTAAGNLLWKMEPRADLGGASVAAKDHVISSPASITAFALGIKLVPAGTPIEPPICCYRF